MRRAEPAIYVWRVLEWIHVRGPVTDNTVKLWDAQNGACTAMLEGHSNIVSYMYPACTSLLGYSSPFGACSAVFVCLLYSISWGIQPLYQRVVEVSEDAYIKLLTNCHCPMRHSLHSCHRRWQCWWVDSSSLESSPPQWGHYWDNTRA